jgi:hypothetical protein
MLSQGTYLVFLIAAMILADQFVSKKSLNLRYLVGALALTLIFWIMFGTKLIYIGQDQVKNWFDLENMAHE